MPFDITVDMCFTLKFVETSKIVILEATHKYFWMFSFRGLNMFSWGACLFHACSNSQKMTVGSMTSNIVGFRSSFTSIVCLIINGVYIL